MAPKAGPSKGKSKPKAEAWRRSASPMESWDDDGASAEGEWSVRIVGEEVDYWQDVRYEVEWDSWKRKDGTNNTWKYCYVTNSGDMLSIWRRRQTFRRRKLANESVDIELYGGLDIHNNGTRLRAQAFEEKLERTEAEPCTWAEERLKLIAEREHGLQERPTSPGIIKDEPLHLRRPVSLRPLSRRASSRTVSSASQASPNGSAPSFRLARVLTPSSPATTLASIESPRSGATLSSPEIPIFDNFIPQFISAKAQGKQRAVEPIVSRRSAPPRAAFSARRRAHESRRDILSAEWSQCAPVTFRNDVDDEEVPPLPVNFKYIEKGYEFDPDIPGRENLVHYLLSCSCAEACSLTKIASCDCQILYEHEQRACAYDNQGLFLFRVARGQEVLECTPSCRCGVDCPNRVVQRDRDVPLEIFKTSDNRGWGVRTKINLRRGKVLGMYSGLLLPRRKAVTMDTEYCFDLDGHEHIISHDDREKNHGYSVDSSRMGNWSRFINHSCDANLQIYEVVYDLPPDSGMPYVAYVASRDIPAGEELTFDYNPKHTEEFAQRPTKYKKVEGGRRATAGHSECRCGALNCRGSL